MNFFFESKNYFKRIIPMLILALAIVSCSGSEEDTFDVSNQDTIDERTVPALVHARQWLVADFNNNSKDNLFIPDHGEDVFNFTGYPNTLLLNSGGGLSNNSSNVGSLNTFTHGAAIGDIDNNGTLDIFMNNDQGLEGIGGATADDFIYLNNSAGMFTGTK
ncbi:MAG: hypothetical protein KJP26_16115 [Maribacter sp.]|nr:hypothetical protein [Maribacter sp.]